MSKVYLCHSDSVLDVGSWEIAFTDNPIGDIIKGESFTLFDIVKAEMKKQGGGSSSAPKAKKPKSFAIPPPPTGDSWSAQLQLKNYPARWVTYNNNRLLIKIFHKDKPNEHARVVFSGNPAFEHLKIVPKTAEEYEEIKKKNDTRKKKRDKQQRVTFTKEDYEASREGKKQKQAEKKEVQLDYLKNLGSALGVPKDIDDSELKDIVDIAQNKFERIIVREQNRLSREKEEELSGTKLDTPIQKLSDELVKEKDPEVTDKALDGLGEKADVEADGIVVEKLLGDGMKEELGIREVKLETANQKVNELFKEIQPTYEQAIALSQMKEKLKVAQKTIDKKYKHDIIPPQSNLEITGMQGVGIIDWDEPEESIDETVDRVLKKEENKLRALRNTELYEKFDDRAGKSTTNKALDLGTLDTINALASVYLRGGGISHQLIELVGVDNAGRMLASAIAKNMGEKEALKEMETFFAQRGQEVVTEVLNDTKIRYERGKNYMRHAEEGTVHKGSAGAAKANQMIHLAKELGMAVGSLQASAAIVDTLRNSELAKGDIIVDAGQTKKKVLEKIEGIGMPENLYEVVQKKDKFGKPMKGYNIVIKHDNFANLFDPPVLSKNRNEMVAKIKAGELYDPNWRPKGMASTNWDWKTPGEYKKMLKEKPEKAKGYEEYKNKKGDPGYTSQVPQGTKLMRKESDTSIYASPQKMIQFGLEQKRAVMNLGAGTGKTMGFLGIIQSVMDKKKMKTYAFHTMPSRLRDEFAKDTEKFFPHMRVLNLDDVQGIKGVKTKMEAQKEALARASNKEYDIVISGHDSMKTVPTVDMVKREVRNRIKAHIAELPDGEREIAMQSTFDLKGKSGYPKIWDKKKHFNAKKKEFLAREFGGKTPPDSFWDKGGKGLKNKWSKEGTVLQEKGREMVAKWRKDAESKTLPQLIADSNPTVVTVDEAHEGFKDVKHKESQRFKAIKTIAKNPEYFIPATGTVVKNTIGELASLLHFTRPDTFKNPTAWARQYGGINQSTTVFQDIGVDAFRQTWDDVMLTEHLTVERDVAGKKGKKEKVKMTERINKIKMTDIQKNKLRSTESIYHAEKKLDGYAIMNRKSYALERTDRKINIDKEIPFKQIVDAEGNMTPKASEYLTKKGYKKTHKNKDTGKMEHEFQLVQLGQRGASARRDSRYDKTLHAGNYKSNAKVQQILKDFKNHHAKGDTQIVFYERKDSLKTLQQAFSKEMGYKMGKEMDFIDGSVKFGKGEGSRNAKVTKFTKNPESKVIFCSVAGMTGINLQTANVVHWLGRQSAYYRQQQGNARAMRTGQEKDVHVYYNDTDTIYDDRKLDLVNRKEKTTSAVGESPDTKVSLIKRIARKKVKKASQNLILTING